MNFAFCSISDGETPEEPEDFTRLPWMGPPEDVLGGTIPSEMMLARTDSVVIALTHITAYPDGCTLALRVAGRRGSMDEDAWWELSDAAFGHRRTRHRHRDGELPDAQRRYAVRFADGTTATTVTVPHHGADSDPSPPLLTDHGGGGGSSGSGTFHIDEHLWLWSLPPAEVFELIVEWPVAGIPVTIVELDGAAITAAAERAMRYWPEG